MPYNLFVFYFPSFPFSNSISIPFSPKHFELVTRVDMLVISASTPAMIAVIDTGSMILFQETNK